MGKSSSLVIFFLICVSAMQAQNKGQLEIVVTSSAAQQTGVYTENGQLHVNVLPKDAARYKAAGSVHYSDFGARGDGKADDMDAIAATHAFANLNGLTVKADDGLTYYISGKERTAMIQTNTDFGKAAFIIDDTEVQNRNASVFTVGSNLKTFKVEKISSLRKNQAKISASLPGPCLITVTNSNVKQYIRFGLNQNNGSSQTDIFLTDKNGNIDARAPIMWDFEQITDITALPIDEKLLKISGGRFTTIANKAESKYTYYNRNILIRRSNVIVDGMKHYVTGEEDHGAPYGGFISINDCSNVTVKNTVLTGHRTYSTIGAADKPVTMGTYDLNANRALNVSFVNCSQTNDINDATYWGILGSNFCKNMLYDSCILSRFDAHQGVANATIRNSTLGHMGINAIGSGLLLIENCTIRGRSIVSLRPDYGSTWQGELIIRNCIFVPADGKPVSASIISGSNSGQHNFGYTCYMPELITIENVRIEDARHPENYQGPAIFSNFNPEMKDDSYKEKFPYIKTKKVILRNVTTASGKTVRVSDNLFMFKDVRVE
ncbi:MAG: hypothetical protein ABI151_12620 [Chitinophagaceae bacterium]